jgi:hypothetical protein
VACAAVLASGGSAAAEKGSTDRADFELRFASATPGSPTAARLYILYKDPDDPDAKPSPIKRVVIEAPAGTDFGVDRVPACAATDDELRAEGRAACSKDSRVGAGSLTAMTGFGPPFDPFPTVVTIFNTGQGFLELVSEEDTDSTLAVDRAAVHGSTAVLTPPSTPGGPPDGQTAVREIDFRFDRPQYLRTPASCPPDGRWRSRGVFTFADGATVAVPSSTPCVAAKERPRLRLRVRPRRVRIGDRVRFRFRVTSDDRRCVRGALVRFAGRRLRTGPRGRAAIVLRLGRPGRRRPVAAHRGCVRDRGNLRALR